MKKCEKCKKEKQLKDFKRCKRNKDGYRINCKDCYKLPKEIKKEPKSGHKICIKCNSEKELKHFVKSSRSKDGLENRCKDCDKKYRQTNKEKISKRGAKYYENNLEKIKKYKLDNKESRRIYENNRRKNDVNFRVLKNLRKSLHRLVKKSKIASTIKLLGCTMDELKLYIKNQFLPGMTWENYGLYTWHIDHIRPCASFDLTDPEQQKICFHYTNLQPMWAKENYSKNSYWEGKLYRKNNKG